MFNITNRITNRITITTTMSSPTLAFKDLDREGQLEAVDVMFNKGRSQYLNTHKVSNSTSEQYRYHKHVKYHVMNYVAINRKA